MNIIKKLPVSIDFSTKILINSLAPGAPPPPAPMGVARILVRGGGDTFGGRPRGGFGMFAGDCSEIFKNFLKKIATNALF